VRLATTATVTPSTIHSSLLARSADTTFSPHEAKNSARTGASTAGSTSCV